MEPFKLIWAGKEMGQVRVDHWPDPLRTYKSIAIHANDFEGTLAIEGSFSVTPGENDWFSYYEHDFVRPTLNENKLQHILLTNRDRVIWLRATYTTNRYGRIDRVLVL